MVTVQKMLENLIDIYKKTRAEGFGDEVKRRIMLGNICIKLRLL